MGEQALPQRRSTIQTIADGYRFLEDAIAVFGMVVFGGIILYEVILRILGRSGIPWSQEFSQYVLIISVFIGSSRAVETNDHMVMDILYRVLPQRFAMLLQTFLSVVLTGMSGFMLYLGYQYAAKLRFSGTVTATIKDIKMWVIWIPIVICLATMTLRYFLTIFKNFKFFLTAENVVVEKSLDDLKDTD